MSVSIILLRSLMAELRARGLDAQSWLASCGIPLARVLDAHEMLNYEEARTAIRCAVELSRDPSIGHAAGLRTPASALPAISPMLLAQGTVREAAKFFIRYARLVSEGSLYVLREEGSDAVWGFAPAMPPNAEIRVIADYAIALATRVVRMLQASLDEDGGKPPLAAVWFMHPEPVYSEVYGDAYGCPILFQQELNALVVAKEVLDRPLPFADQCLPEYLREPAEKKLREALGKQTWSARVRFVLEHAQSFAGLDLAAVAQRVQATERNLRRALQREQTSFAALLEESRERVARAQLAQRELSIVAISTLLGYSSQSSFGRAFRAWTGFSPAEYRARHRSSA